MHLYNRSFHLLYPFFVHLPFAKQSKVGEEASDTEMGIQYKAHREMQESERWKTKRARGEETTG